jgi:hypothetical protein
VDRSFVRVCACACVCDILQDCKGADGVRSYKECAKKKWYNNAAVYSLVFV